MKIILGSRAIRINTLIGKGLAKFRYKGIYTEEITFISRMAERSNSGGFIFKGCSLVVEKSRGVLICSYGCIRRMNWRVGIRGPTIKEGLWI